jgi:hypothetical protein
MVDEHLEPLRRSLGLGREEFLGLGRVRPEDQNEALCMTVLAFKMSRYANAVSALHGRVTRKSWQFLWPHHREDEVPAGHITNGDYITVIASASLTIFASGKSQSTGPPKVVSKTVFTNVRVIGLGPAQSNVVPASGTATVGGTTPSNGGLTSSLTIELTQCDAEFFTWFLNNTQLRYTLESVNDYQSQPPTGPDTQNCPNGFDSAKGVSQTQVEARYHFTSL